MTVERLAEKAPTFRIDVKGAPPLRGWAIMYVSGIEDAQLRRGFWLSQWVTEETSVRIAFGPDIHMVFPSEESAQFASSALGQQDIETEVVRLP